MFRIGLVDSEKAKDVAHNVVEKTSDAVSRSTDTVNAAAHGIPSFALV